MIYIQKNEEPKWLSLYKKNNPTATYDTESFNSLKNELRKELLKEQHYLCAYCCSRIGIENSHNEHIEPRNPKDGISRKSLAYSNIIASCNNTNTCGRRKKNEYNPEKFISPLNPKCEDIFTYYPDGIVEGDQYTIDLLNLNAYELREARKAVYRTIMALDLDIETIELIYSKNSEQLQSYYNVIKWFIKVRRGKLPD